MRVVLCLFCILILASCASTSIKKKDIKSLTKQPETFLISQEESSLIKKSDKLHTKLVEQGLIINNPELNQYIQKIGDRISPNFEAHVSLNYFIIRDASINAFAMPNGNIYLNVGLLTQLQNEEEIAFVLGHEIAHVVERHGLIKLVDRKDTVVGSHVADLFLMGTGFIYYATITELASFSRKMETSADEAAIKYLFNAGYGIEKAKVAITRLYENDYEIERGSIWNSHPDINKRNQDINIAIKNLPPVNKHLVSLDERIALAPKLLEKLTLLVVKIRLRNKQYELAESFLNKEISKNQQNGQLYYYLAETNRLKIKNLRDYAKEHAWLYDKSFNEKLVTELSDNKSLYLEIAKSSYTKAESLSPDIIKINRGRGLLAFVNNNNNEAKTYLNQYLTNQDITDRLYIQSIVKSL